MTRLVYVGHGTVIVELDGVRLLTDPVLRWRVAHLRRHGSVDESAFADIDAVLLSHVHYDHLNRASLRRLDPQVPVVVPRGAGRLLRRFSEVREIDVGDETAFGPVRVRATPALHPSTRPLVRGSSAVGFVLHGSQQVYFAGDTDLFDDMTAIAQPPLDLALLPVAGWGPRVGEGHLDPRRAAEALRLLRPRVAVPIHWGTLSLPWRRPSDEAPEAFRRLAGELAPDVEVRVLAPGATTTL